MLLRLMLKKDESYLDRNVTLVKSRFSATGLI